MENDADKKPLNWPEIFDPEVVEQHEVIEYKLHVDFMTMDELLFELEHYYPHVCKKLEMLKGSEAFNTELSKLIIDQRGNRQGFPKHVMEMLLKLTVRHLERYGY